MCAAVVQKLYRISFTLHLGVYVTNCGIL